MSEAIERPRNCGECVRMNEFHAVIAGVEYDGGCPEHGVPVRNGDVCHPNVGVKAPNFIAPSGGEPEVLESRRQQFNAQCTGE